MAAQSQSWLYIKEDLHTHLKRYSGLWNEPFRWRIKPADSRKILHCIQPHIPTPTSMVYFCWRRIVKNMPQSHNTTTTTLRPKREISQSIIIYCCLSPAGLRCFLSQSIYIEFVDWWHSMAQQQQQQRHVPSPSASSEHPHPPTSSSKRMPMCMHACA